MFITCTTDAVLGDRKNVNEDMLHSFEELVKFHLNSIIFPHPNSLSCFLNHEIFEHTTEQLNCP
jgi:hypothetical protein